MYSEENISYSFATTAGRRENNQDSYRIVEIELSDGKVGLLALVADGMGGAKAGDLASQIAADEFVNYVESHLLGISPKTSYVRSILLQGFLSAHQKIVELSTNNPEVSGMGTTLVAVFVWGNQYIVANVGDSRAYLIDPGDINQITKDHSEVQLMVDHGIISKEEARHHPRKNIITQSLGDPYEQPSVDIFPSHGAFNVIRNTIILLCSDGLVDGASDGEIHDLITSMSDLNDTAQSLTKLAFDGGSKDNITVVLIEFGKMPRDPRARSISTPPTISVKAKKKIKKKKILVPLSHVIIGAVVVFAAWCGLLLVLRPTSNYQYYPQMKTPINVTDTSAARATSKKPPDSLEIKTMGKGTKENRATKSRSDTAKYKKNLPDSIDSINSRHDK